MTFYEAVFKSKMEVRGETCALISSFPREHFLNLKHFSRCLSPSFILLVAWMQLKLNNVYFHTRRQQL